MVHTDGTLLLESASPGHPSWRSWPVAMQEDNEIDVGHVWMRTQRSLCEQFPGRFHAQALPGGVAARITLLGHGREPVGAFTASYRLDGPHALVTVTAIDESLRGHRIAGPG